MNRRKPRPSLRLTTLCLLAVVALASPGMGEESEEPASLTEALKKGKPIVNLRYRIETVDQDPLTKEATASTLRTVIGYKSASYKGFSLFGEAENVTVVGNELYNSTRNGIIDRPVVADPDGTEINQAFLRYQNDAWKFTLGRQEVLLGDVRYVGNVGWRQNHQSFDAFRVETEWLERAKFDYAFLDQVNRIFGDSQDHSSHLFNAILDAGQIGKVTLYSYLLDYRDAGAVGLSTATYGLEVAGKRELNDGLSFLYELEYAQQSDWEDNPNNVDVAYNFVMLGAAFRMLTAKLGWEVLEGSPGEGSFRTPLATLHKFNGWADKFLATPATGLEDLYLQLSGKAAAFKWLVAYHDFDADTGGAAYGSEIDLQVLYTAPCKVVLGLKGALYDADSFATDTDKWMVWANYSF